MPRVRSAAVLVFATLMLATGCAGQPAAQPGAGGGSTPTAPVASEPQPATEPVLPFGGDCAAILSTDEVAGFRGLAVDEPVRASDTVLGAGIESSGGLVCRWPVSGGYHGGLVVAAFPDAAVPDALREEHGGLTCAPVYDGYAACGSAETVDGTWLLTWTELLTSDTAVDAPAGHAEAAALIAERAAGQPAAAAATPADGWWSPAVCDGLATALDLSALLGAGEVTAGSGTDAGHQIEVRIGATLPTYTICEWSAGGSSVSVEIAPGGARAWDAVSAVAEQPVQELTVAGTTRAVQTPGQQLYPAVLLADDVNLARFAFTGSVDPEQFAAALVAALAG